MAKVSVLVAVYNASAYLRQCLDSLLHQTHDDIQVICVDDCSTDDSLSILHHYSAIDKRVEVYHLDSNQGQAHARNVALLHATGEYICMLDSDDWFSADALEKAVSAFDVNTDCVLFDVLMEWGDRTERYEMPEFNPLTGDLIIPAGEEITEDIANLIESLPIEQVEIRSVLTCESRKGVCAKCYGRNLASGRMVEKGEVVGVIAAQSIGEPGTQLTLRTFHVGGTASSTAAENAITSKYNGKLEFEELRTIERITEDGVQDVVVSRTTEVRIVDENTGITYSQYDVPYGSVLYKKDGEKMVFQRGTIVDPVWNNDTTTKKTQKARKNLQQTQPYKLIVLRKIDENNYLVAICKKEKKNTQLEIDSVYTKYISFDILPKEASLVDETISYEVADKTILDVESNTGKILPRKDGKTTVTCVLDSDNSIKATVFVNVHLGYVKGDLDRNNLVDANDASIALEIFKSESQTQEDLKYGDMDDNGIIDANDASLILEVYKINK